MTTPTASRHFSPLLVLFFGILIVSTSSIFIRFAQEGAASIVIAAYRLTLATAILLPLALRGHRPELAALRKPQLILIGLSGAFLALHFASWITSLEYTSVASSAVLVTTTPLWVALFSPLFLRERPSRVAIIGLLIALAGGALVAMSETCSMEAGRIACPPLGTFFRGDAMFGNLLALVGALAATAYMLVGRRLRPTMSLMVYITTVYGTAAVVLLALALLSGERLGGFAPGVYAAFLALAVGPQLLGHTSFNYGLRYLPAAFVSVALLGEPVGTTILALIILKEIPTTLEVAGGIVLLVGIFLASRGQK